MTLKFGLVATLFLCGLSFVLSDPKGMGMGMGMGMMGSSSSRSMSMSMSSSEESDSDDWNGHGGSVRNQRSASLKNIDISSPTWVTDVGGAVSATPTTLGGVAFFPTWSGAVVALEVETGNVIWSIDIGTTYYGETTEGEISARASAVTKDDMVLFFVQRPADVIALNQEDGALLWKMTVGDHPTAKLTQSGTIVGNYLYQGVSTSESSFAANPSYPCCSFRGRFKKIDLRTQTVVWDFSTIPEDIVGVGKFSGASVWGSSPSINRKHNIVYIGTGQNYQVPQDYQDCIASNDEEDYESVCNTGDYADNYFNSLIGLDMDTGETVFARRVTGYDAWSLACPPVQPIGNPNCPDIIGPDYDFGMAPMLDNNGKRMYAAQKAGIIHAVDALTGEPIWSTQTCPGGELGGHNWGAAMDDDTIYAGCVNSKGSDWTLKNGTVIQGGGWVALDKATGEVKWTTANPAAFDTMSARSATSYGVGPPTVIKDAVLVTSADTAYDANGPISGSGGYIYSLDKNDGSIKASYETLSSVYGGFSASDNCAIVGTGYLSAFGLSWGTKVFGFCK